MNLGGNFLTEPGNLSQENMELFATLKPADKQHLIETRSLPAPFHPSWTNTIGGVTLHWYTRWPLRLTHRRTRTHQTP